MNMNDAFPSAWLKAGDLPEDEDLILTVKSVQMEEIGQGDDRQSKPVVYFKDDDKGLVLNKTNADVIVQLYGADTDAWIGKKLALFATQVDFRGKATLAIRVRLKKPRNVTQEEAAVPAGAGAGRQSKKDLWEDE